MAATTKKLDYADVPPRATSSRSIRTEVLPSSGSSFNMNNTIIFDLPSNVSNTFADFQSSYVRLNITNNDADDAAINFEGGGFPSAIKRLEVLQGGQTIASINEYGVLYQMLLDLDTSGQFRSNAGARLFGAANSAVGEQLAAGAANTRQVCFPLALMPLTQSSKYYPLMGREPLRIRLELYPAKTAFKANDDALEDSEITIDEVALVMYQLELGQSVMDQVVANSGGMFKMVMPSYQHHQATLAAGATSVATTLGFSMSSLDRILVAQRRQLIAGNTISLGNRSQLQLTDCNVKIGGIQYPQIKIKDRKNSGAEVLAEALVSQRALLSYGHDSSIELGSKFNAQEPTGADNDNTGHFVIEIDLESQRVDAGSLVAGVNCISSTVQFESTYGAGAGVAHTIDVFGQHSIMVALDLQSMTTSIAV